MHAHDIASQLPLEILSDLTDAVIVTDNDQHVLYWNGPAERLYGLEAQQSLGRHLDACCPELSAQAPNRAHLDQVRKWTGEIVLRPGEERVIYLECSVRVLQDRNNLPVGLLWILRDNTARKKLESELRHCQELLRQDALSWDDLERTRQAQRREPGEGQPPGASKDVILWAEDDENDAVLMARAWQKARVNAQLFRVRDGAEVIRYLRGEHEFEDRRRYPLPSLLLLDIKMPGKSGLDVIHWLQTQPELHSSPVVILTSSACREDIHEAARFGVKGYLIKPVDVTEWVLKVQTVTSQCK